MDGLKVYLTSALLADCNRDVDALIDEYLEGMYGLGAPYLRRYIELSSASVQGHRLGIYDAPDAPYFTDAALGEYDRLFTMAEEAECGEVRERIAREHLAIEYARTARIEDDEKRSQAVDALAKKVLHFRLTEIMERRNLYDSFDFMKRSRYAKDRTGQYNMYYVVK